MTKELSTTVVAYLEDIIRDCESEFDKLRKITEMLSRKDAKILEKNIILERQDKVIRGLIFETHQLKEKLINYRFYPAHPKDEYKINFGFFAWRKYTYRQCVSTRAGKKICNWALAKNNIKSAKILEFKQYLIDLGFNSQSNHI